MAKCKLCLFNPAIRGGARRAEECPSSAVADAPTVIRVASH
jgi:hypothetical protein